MGSEMCIRDRLHVGEKVLIQHHATKDWSDAGTIIEQREDRLSYIVETDDGRSFIRGRRLLKPHSDVQDPTPDTLQPPV